MLYLALIALAAVLTVIGFLTATPRQLALGLRYAAPTVLAILGLVLTFAGRGSVGMGLIGLAAVLFSRAGRRASVTRSAPRRSHVRSAALEMELDLDSGEMNGLVLVGRHEGKELDAMSEEELIELYGELASDPESVQLLEAYLDRRLSAWRDRLDPDAGDGLGAAPRAGPMTEKDAYEVLGLRPGATEAQIREAHRRLMKRVHPDAGGSVFLAARINEAKDLLLRRHH